MGFADILKIAIELHSIRSPNAMRNREIPSLLGVKIILIMGITSEHDIIPSSCKILNQGQNPMIITLGFWKAEASFHKIVLIINNNQKVFHVFLL